MHKVIANIKQFEKDFPKLVENKEKKEATKKYLQNHGVMKLIPREENKWPKLIYPTISVIENKLKDSISKKKIYSKKLGEWKKKRLDASMYHQVNQIKKFSEPIYWKHLAKTVTDSDYRKDAKTVKLPAHLVNDKKWKPMVKMFVNDLEYRKQLTETVSTSLVYKKDRKVAKFADDQQDFRLEAANKQINELEEKIKQLNETQSSLKILQKWSRE